MPLTAAQRKSLKARAHALQPVVLIGGNGLTEAVLKEIDASLKAHELIKVRVYGDDRSVREGYLNALCERLGAAPVQHIGKLLVLWRPAPADATPVRRVRKPAPRTKRSYQN
jgi:putative YhbY family RNA-binding protein